MRKGYLLKISLFSKQAVPSSLPNGVKHPLAGFVQGNGSTPTLAAALSEALTYLTHTLAGDATVIEDLLRSQN